jgi:hypothetical protein
MDGDNVESSAQNSCHSTLRFEEDEGGSDTDECDEPCRSK